MNEKNRRAAARWQANAPFNVMQTAVQHKHVDFGLLGALSQVLQVSQHIKRVAAVATMHAGTTPVETVLLAHGRERLEAPHLPLANDIGCAAECVLQGIAIPNADAIANDKHKRALGRSSEGLSGRHRHGTAVGARLCTVTILGICDHVPLPRSGRAGRRTGPRQDEPGLCCGTAWTLVTIVAGQVSVRRCTRHRNAQCRGAQGAP